MQNFVHALPVNHRLTSLREKLSLLFSETLSYVQTARDTSGSRVKTLFNKKKIGTYLFIAIVAIAIMAGIRTAFSSNSRGENLGAVAPDAVTVPVEREFLFNVYDKNKELADPVRYVITSAQLTKQIVIKGQKATAVTGRTFFILNLKLVNDFDKSLFLNTRNYVRVQPAGTEDKLAPEIHNDTVEVQPLSTKLTRIGLPVNEGDKEFIIHVGELDGAKEFITVKFE